MPIIDNIEHGALYELKVTNVSVDYESGYADDWDIEFVKIPKKPTKKRRKSNKSLDFF